MPFSVLGSVQDALLHLVIMLLRAPLDVTVSQIVLDFDDLGNFEECWLGFYKMSQLGFWVISFSSSPEDTGVIGFLVKTTEIKANHITLYQVY